MATSRTNTMNDKLLADHAAKSSAIKGRKVIVPL